MDIISNIGFNESVAKSKDMRGRVYEYSPGKFVSAEGTLQSLKLNCNNRRNGWPCASTITTWKLARMNPVRSLRCCPKPLSGELHVRDTAN